MTLSRRAARRTAQLLREAELDRIRRSRLALESRLQALQARVEPQFLFNTLDQVERELEAGLGLPGRGGWATPTSTSAATATGTG